MTKPYCKGCRFYSESSGMTLYAGWCNHDDAKIFDRIHGYITPVVKGIPSPSLETLEKCDENGWFEEKTDRRKWWQLRNG